MTKEQAVAFLNQMFQEVFTESGKLEYADRYYTKDYVAISNCNHLDRKMFDDHVLALQRDIRKLECSYDEVITAPDKIGVVLSFAIEKTDGSIAKIRSHTFYTLRDGKIAELQELTHVMEGGEEDSDIASRTG